MKHVFFFYGIFWDITITENYKKLEAENLDKGQITFIV